MIDIEKSRASLRAFIEEKNPQALEALLEEIQPADIAEMFEEMKIENIVAVLQALDNETVAAILKEMDPDLIEEIAGQIGKPWLAEVLSDMSSDAATDLINELPVEERKDLLDMMDQDEATEVRELLEYPEDTAGGIMATEYVALLENITVAKAIEVLRETAPDAETVYYVFVVDANNKLVGVVSLRELIVSDPNSKVLDIMNKKVISVSLDTDQEEVANIVSKYDFLAVPVVDEENRLEGIITVDDVIDVIHEEASEDIYRLAGTKEIEYEDKIKDFIVTAMKSRLPWLFVTLFGCLLAGNVIRHMEVELQAVVALAYFIPLLMGMGGNVGTQSSTVTVRGLAVGHIDGDKIFWNVLKETLVGVAVGLVCGILVAIVAFFWQKSMVLGLVVGLALTFNMMIAAFMGTLVPLIFKKIGIDPAVASAPFISTTIDITGLLVYALLASLFISFLI